MDRTAKQRQSKRRARLDETARNLGYMTWAQLETAVINDRVAVTLEYKLRPGEVIHHNCKCQLMENPR